MKKMELIANFKHLQMADQLSIVIRKRKKWFVAYWMK